jgi:hypothetical protein
MFQNNWFQIRSIGYFFAFRFEITIQWFAGRKKQKNRGLGRDDHKGRWSHMPYAQEGHLKVVKTLLDFGGRELAMIIREDGARCLLMKGARGASGGGESAAGVWRARARNDYQGQWSQMPLDEGAGGASEGGESAAGVSGPRARDADQGRWNQWRW